MEESTFNRERLRVLRDSHNLTQADLARAVGVRRVTICDIERGATKRPDADTIRKIADLFGVSPASFYREPNTIPPDIQAAVELLKKMTPAQRSAVSAMLAIMYASGTRA